MRSSRVWMRSSREWMRSSRVWMRSSREWMRSSRVWDLAECGLDLAECRWDLAEECGWDLAEIGWDLVERGWDLAEWLERLAVNAYAATVLDSIPKSSDRVDLRGADEAVKNVHLKKKSKKSPFNFFMANFRHIKLKRTRIRMNAHRTKRTLTECCVNKKKGKIEP